MLFLRHYGIGIFFKNRVKTESTSFRSQKKGKKELCSAVLRPFQYLQGRNNVALVISGRANVDNN